MGVLEQTAEYSRRGEEHSSLLPEPLSCARARGALGGVRSAPLLVCCTLLSAPTLPCTLLLIASPGGGALLPSLLYSSVPRPTLPRVCGRLEMGLCSVSTCTLSFVLLFLRW